MAPETEHDDLIDFRIPSLFTLVAVLAGTVLMLSLLIPWAIDQLQEKQTADIVPPPPPVAASTYDPTYNEYIKQLKTKAH